MAEPSDLGSGTGERVYRDPRVTISRVYTRHGDAGTTGLVGGRRVPKDDLRIDAYGTVDELITFTGVARQSAIELLAGAELARRADVEALAGSLERVQHELFNLGSLLATLPEDEHPRQPRVTQAEIDLLEQEMDACQRDLPALRSFVLPGGTRLNADLHVCRTVCRRAERIAVALDREAQLDRFALAYLNRLSDAFFVWSRWANHVAGVEECLWDPNRAASARR